VTRFAALARGACSDLHIARRAVFVLFAAAALLDCSSSESGGAGSSAGAGVAGSAVGLSGGNAAAGSGALGASGNSGAEPSNAGAPSAGASGSPDLGGAQAAGAGGQPISGGAAGAAGTAGSGSDPLGDITKIAPTAGCGKDPGQAIGTAVKGTIATMGTKDASCADSKCGAWSYTREYYVTLPKGYDKSKAYPLVLQGSGCGGDGRGVYPLDGLGEPLVNNTVIGVGLSPPPTAIGHVVTAGPGGAGSATGLACFDDKEGDDSVDWIFYEDLYDKLSTELCFDRNRVFSAGFSTGAWFTNELGCKYAGDAKRPVRGIMPNTGGLPSEPEFEPTCTNKPMTGMWVGQVGDVNNPWTGNEFAISRAMKVNGCAQSSYDQATYVDFPIGGNNATSTCKKIVGCPDLYPLVVCALPGTAHSSNDSVVNPGFATFLKMFEAAPYLTP
jgi:hypothetical protein